ncbi:vWA domain-containing protein [Vagococcus fluvialis]|uniref:vWA domain-containing protein n=1 Tax=Vagococcus fluvialis TaxID=2738 RepID=UPI003B5B5F6B
MKGSKITKKFFLLLMTMLMIFPMNLVQAAIQGLQDSSEKIAVVNAEVDENKETDSKEEATDSTEEDIQTKKDESKEKENTNEDPEKNLKEDEKEIDPTEEAEEFKNIPDITPAAINFPHRIDNNIQAAEEEVVYNKSAKSNGDGTYQITLESYAKGESIKSTIEKVVPTDIVMVIDESGSMNTLDMNQPLSTTEPKKRSNRLNYSDRGQLFYKKEVEGSIVGSYKEVFIEREVTSGNSSYSYYYLNEKDERVYLKDSNNNPSTGDYTEFDVAFYSTSNIKKVSNMTVLKAVLETMVDQLASDARKNDVNHRVAMVGFSYVNQTRLFVDGSYVELGGGQRSNPGNGIRASHYRRAYEDMNTVQGLTNVKNYIDKLDGRGGTYIDTGNMVGNKVFEHNPIPLRGEEERNRIYVVFTDGVPGPLAALSGYDQNTESGAIREANIAKRRHNAPVYTVGVFEDADQTVRGPDRFEKSYARANWFMQQMSSNNGEPQEPSYYLSARNGDRLLESFLEIVNVTNSNETKITLNEDTIIRDRIPAYFDMDNESITVKTKKFIGQSEADESNEEYWVESDDNGSTSIEVEADEVIVSGFDYSANYVGPRTVDGNTVYEGSKLEITFNVTPNSKFLGGNNVPTNVDAGIYKEKESEKPLYVFDKPKVDVPIKDFDVQVEDKNIYLNSSLDGEQLKNDAKVTFNQGTNQEFTLDLSKASDETHPYGLDETWQNEFVNISHDLVELDENGEVKTDQDGNPIIIEETDFKNLRNDSKYTVSVTISPKEEAATDEPALAKEKNDSGDIHVFKPIITYTDGSVYYGENTIDNFENYRLDEGQEKWLWIDEEENKVFSTDVTMNDPTIPNLVYEENYVKDSDNLDGKVNTKNDMYLKSTIKIDDMDISDDVYFEHECGVLDDCSFDPEKGQFMIHVKTVTLDIEKRGGKVKDPYVFSILRADLDAENYEDYTEAAIVRTRNLDGSDSITIKQLPVGKYKVIENTDWSWRYNPTYQAERYTTADKKKEESALGDQMVELTPSYDLGKVSVENTKDPEKDNWLSGFSDLISNIFGEAQKIGNNEDGGGSS